MDSKIVVGAFATDRMPLTRHLYRQDEVVAALMWGVLRCRPVEASFWCMELVDSGLVEDALKALKDVWFYGFGVKALGCLRDFENPLQLVSALCRVASNSGRDRSILTLLCSDGEEDRVNICPIPEGFGEVEGFALRAILQRKTLAAWGAVRSLPAPDVFLQKAALHKHGIEGGKFLATLDWNEWERRAVAVAALCLSKEEFAVSWSRALGPVLAEVVAELPVWAKLRGRRARRLYKIPPECLGLTERGKASVYETNEDEIIGTLEKPNALWNSPFWEAAVAKYGGWGGLEREAFYEKYFPDDIPDEWSKEERAKSHGFGASADHEKTFQAWYGRLPAAVLWKPFRYRKWDSLGLNPISWALRPVKRIITPEAC